MTEDKRSTYQATRQFLEDHPKARDAVETVLAVDSRNEAWTFNDISLESGIFGEVVAREIVIKKDGGYAVKNRNAVEAALEGKEFGKSDESSSLSINFSVGDQRWQYIGLLGAIIVVFITRALHYQSVFREGRVVSPGNDQYRYRYWMERLLADSTGPLDFDVVVGAPWGYYAQSWNERPLTHAANWFLAELLGGDQAAADIVTAWSPVVMAVIVVIIVYKITLMLTEDPRSSLISVLVVGLAPIHAVYSRLGWLSNRQHQYLWFTVVLFAVIWLAKNIQANGKETDNEIVDQLRSTRVWLVVGVLGIGLAAWTHSWAGSASLFVPLVAYIGLRTLLDVREDISPGLANLPLLVGIGLGAILSVTIHVAWDWHGILAIGAAVTCLLSSMLLVGLGELWHRIDRTPAGLLALQGAVILSVVLILALRPPEVIQYLWEIAFSAPASGRSSQAQSLFGSSTAFFFGPLVQIGVPFFIALGVLGWCGYIVQDRYEPMWLVGLVFGLYYLAASAIMLRFAGKLVIVIAPLAALGIVYILWKLDLANRPTYVQKDPTGQSSTSPKPISIPTDRRQIGYVILIGLLVFGLNLVYLPIFINNSTHNEGQFETAMVISDHAEQTQRNYPEDHVFAPWSEYRMYNYFVNGESESEAVGRYHYSKIYSSNDTTIPFDYSGNQPSGYVVVSQVPFEPPEGSVYDRLYIDVGSPDSGLDTLDQYRLIHISENENILAYAVVTGARLEISGEHNSTVSVNQDVSVSGHTFSYNQTVQLDSDGVASVRVPYPGKYRVNDSMVSVSETDVETGETVRVEL